MMQAVRRSGGQAVRCLLAAVWLSALPPYRLTALQAQDPIITQFSNAERLIQRGRRDEARRGYAALIATYNRGGSFSTPQLTAMGTAAERLSMWEPDFSRDALRLYDEAASIDPADPEPRLRAAALLLSRYNGAEAARSYADIRRRFPRNARALLGVAEVRRFLGEGDPVATAESSLALDPRLADAHVALGRFHLEGGDWDGALREGAAALAIDRKSSGGYGVRAAVAFLRNQASEFQSIDRAATADDPTAAGHLVFAADAAARTRRYADAVTLAERAVARDSMAWHGWAVLGVNRLRVAEMVTGRAALETALRGDPFDLWTKNTLDLLDAMRTFREAPSARFRFVMDQRESALLSLYALPLAEDAYDRLATRYGVRPAAPVRVEVFPRHADFSVRTVGLAGIGALGACFGPVIAMDSPSARDRGQFNWGSTLWHEIAHTFHLALSENRVPRWLTEGLAVLEERRARPGWGASAGPDFLSAYLHDSLPPLSRLNEGFSRPSSAIMLGHAYMLASLAAEYLESAHGEDITPRMLRGYARGLDAKDVTRQILNTNPDTLDARFDAWVRTKYQAAFADLNGYAQGMPSMARVRALAQAGDSAGAIRVAARLAAEDESSYDANLWLANALEASGRLDGALAALERTLYISPLDPALHDRLATHYARANRRDDVVRERRALIALGPTDRAGAYFRLAQAQVAANQPAEARRAVLRALEIAPGYADAQDLLLRLSEGRQ